MQNKKKIITLVIGVCAVILLNVITAYTQFTSKKTSISGVEYDSTVEEDVTEDFIKKSDVLVQYFQPTMEQLESIELRFLRTADEKEYKENDKIVVALYDSKQKLIWESYIKMENIENWKYKTFKINQKLIKNKKYKLVLHSYKDVENEAATVHCITVSSELKENISCSFNEDILDKNLDIIYQYNYIDYDGFRIMLYADIIFALMMVVMFAVRKFIPKINNSQIMNIIVYMLIPIAMYVIYELIQDNLFTVQLKYVFINLGIFYIVYFALISVFGKFKIAEIIYLIGMTILALIEYFVLLFRGRPFMFADLINVNTAISVVGSYKIKIDATMGAKLMTVLVLIMLGGNLQNIRLPRKKAIAFFRVCFLVGMISCCLVIGNTGILQQISNDQINFWDINSNYQEKGSIYTLLLECNYNHVKKPAGYSVSKVRQIEKSIDESSTEDVGDIQPENIILIMNESLADMSHIGDVQTDTAILPNIKTLEKNTTKGWLQVPVFGAGTAESEYEVLTGNSKQFLAMGSTAYELYCNNGDYSIASELKRQGYQTYALHPYYAENWNRSNIYPAIGFDEFFSIENWGRELANLRWCASDQSSYEKLKNIIENKKDGSKTFSFLVTMQNHGGYDESSLYGFESTVNLKYKKNYPMAETYLSLINETDIAFYNLIEYCEGLKQPTMIVMFGDHYPAIEDGFYEELYGKKLDDLTLEETQLRYQTPYIIWTNYDCVPKQSEDMSANYFGSYILETAGLKMSLYDKALLQLRENIPIIGMGAIKGDDGEWYEMNDLPEKYKSLIENYEILQYNKVVDKKHIDKELFEKVN